ncbi:hypothetical protein ACOCJ7_09880 [Knoellia sp. CPCC 206453]|uniref:hypothetical protein n=1 Tax=Knoellia pratensis TaxID=3404796 RepID=UPI003606426C
MIVKICEWRRIAPTTDTEQPICAQARKQFLAAGVRADDVDIPTVALGQGKRDAKALTEEKCLPVERQ